MHLEDALKFVDDRLVQQGKKRLNDVQRAVFRGAWEDKSYKDIRRIYNLSCSANYLMKDVGYELWQILAEVLHTQVGKKNLRGPVERAYKQPETLLNPSLDSAASGLSTTDQQNGSTPAVQAGLHHPISMPQSRSSWDGVPDVYSFQGRSRELNELIQWLTLEKCRLLCIVGIAKVGKTYLSVRLAQEIRRPFECLIWRSLSHPPPLQELLADLISFISNGQETEGSLPRLMHYLRTHPCLIILDGFEAVLQDKVHDGSYLPGYEAYGELLRQLGSINHQSRIILTSQEKPKQIANEEGDTRPIRSKKLNGVGYQSSQGIVTARGEDRFLGSERDWRTLVSRYQGHPQVLNIVATQIWEVFNGQIAEFLEQVHQDPIPAEIRGIFKQQLERLSELEDMILRSLAFHPDPVEVEDMLSLLPQSLSRAQLIDGLHSLRRRSLLEIESTRYFLPPLMLELLRTNN